MIKLYDCSLQPATALKLRLQILFLKLLRKERMFSNFEKLIENILFYRFKSRISDFNENGIHAKYFLLEFWKVARKRYIIKPFNRVTGLLPRIHVSKKFPTLYFFKEFLHHLSNHKFHRLLLLVVFKKSIFKDLTVSRFKYYPYYKSKTNFCLM